MIMLVIVNSEKYTRQLNDSLSRQGEPKNQLNPSHSTPSDSVIFKFAKKPIQARFSNRNNRLQNQ